MTKRFFNRTKKKFLAVLLVLVMALCLLPGMALAAPAASVYVGNMELENGEYTTNGTSKAATPLPADGYAYFSTENGIATLTLKNFSYTGGGHADTCIYANGDVTIALADGTSSSMTSTAGDAITCTGKLTVSGTGSLSATGGSSHFACGLSSIGGIEITGGSVTGESVSVDGNGVYCGGAVTVSGGSLTGTSTIDSGVKTGGAITLSGSASLTGTSDTGHGVECDTLTVSGSAVLTATGGTAAGMKGLNAAGAITISGGTVTLSGAGGAVSNPPDLNVYNAAHVVIASSNVNGSAPVSYAAANIANYKYFRITPTYTITGKVTGSDAAGVGLAGATVQLKQGTTNIGGAITTDLSGTYAIADVPAGTGYTIGVSMAGYDTGTIPSFAVTGANVPDKDITLAKITPPAISVQPASQSVTEGQTATFSVTATGNPAPNYVWEYNDSSGSGWSEISFATSASYTTSATTTDMSGYQYRCKVTNSQGTDTSTAATLTVTNAPIDPSAAENGISGITAGASIKQGETVTFTAAGGGMPNSTPQTGDKRWLPTHWETNPSGNFDSGFTQGFSTAGMTAGAHTLSVTFTQQRFDGTAWVNTGTTDQKSVAFTVAAAPVTPDTPDIPETPDTGDHSAPNLWIGLAGIALAGIVFSASLLRRKRSAHTR